MRIFQTFASSSDNPISGCENGDSHTCCPSSPPPPTPPPPTSQSSTESTSSPPHPHTRPVALSPTVSSSKSRTYLKGDGGWGMGDGGQLVAHPFPDSVPSPPPYSHPTTRSFSAGTIRSTRLPGEWSESAPAGEGKQEKRCECSAPSRGAYSA